VIFKHCACEGLKIELFEKRIIADWTTISSIHLLVVIWHDKKDR